MIKARLFKRSVNAIILTITTGVLVFGFQNCAAQKTGFTPAENIDSNLGQVGRAVTPVPICEFNGVKYKDGEAVTAFISSSVPVGTSCASESRICKDGVFSGSFNFANCSVQAAASCLFDGKTVASGNSVSAFVNSSAPFGTNCVSQKRTCTNGVLSGSGNFAACSVQAPASCLFDGKTLASGESVQTFLNSNVSYGNACVPQTRTCTNGVLSGSGNFGSCVVDAPVSCLFNGKTLASGQSVQTFLKSSVPFGSACARQTRTCSNGILSGSGDFETCSVGAAASCLFDGKTLASGESVQAFASSSVPFGSTCAKQTRTCTNGVLSGAGNFASCSVDAKSAKLTGEAHYVLLDDEYNLITRKNSDGLLDLNLDGVQTFSTDNITETIVTKELPWFAVPSKSSYKLLDGSYVNVPKREFKKGESITGRCNVLPNSSNNKNELSIHSLYFNREEEDKLKGYYEIYDENGSAQRQLPQAQQTVECVNGYFKFSVDKILKAAADRIAQDYKSPYRIVWINIYGSGAAKSRYYFLLGPQMDKLIKDQVSFPRIKHTIKK